MTSNPFVQTSQPVYVASQLVPGSEPVNGVTIRCLQDTPEDANFAATLTIEAFRGKFAHCVTEQKIPIAVKHQTVCHTGQSQGFYNRTFVAEYHGRPVGLVHIKFKGDKDPNNSDHISELGCWHACRYVCLGAVTTENVDRHACYVDHICVSDGARGKGVGKLLLDRADYEARVRNCSMMYLYVMTTNRAIHLYERHGYRITDSSSMCGCLGCCMGPPGKVYKMEKFLVS